jgi:hypothetical protein
MMVRTHKALLQRNRLEWLEEAPEAQTDQPLSVQVTILEQGTAAEEVSRGQAMAALLEQLASRGTLSDMADPVKWQRALRRDRSLPGRER